MTSNSTTSGRCRPVSVRDCVLDGRHIYIQSMLSVRSTDLEGNVRQAVELERAGCEILRVSIPDEAAVALIPAIQAKISIPLVADIHFDYRLALQAAQAGVDKIRINPGNIGGEDRVAQVVQACRERRIPIRIGVNSGSVEKDLLERYGGPTAEAMAESAMRHVRLLEKHHFEEIVISIKSSDAATTVKGYRLLAEQCPYPLHLGVTEAGTERMGLIKSAIGIGSLLVDGIGETIRVSLTADPVREIEAARDILRCLGKTGGVEVVSCPTCGRTQIDLISLTHQVEDALKGIKKNIKVAVMGCAVNGPGEAREADLGVAGGDRCGVLFRKGKKIGVVPEDEIVSALLREIEKL